MMGFLSKLWRGLKKVVGAVAVIAAPFIAAPIASAIGISGTIGTALTGAVIGGLGASAAGINPAIGAAIGGIGGFGAARAASGGGGLFSGLFGGGGGGGGATAVGGTAAAGATGAAAAAPAAGLAAPAAAGGGFFSGLRLSNLAPLAMTMFGKAPQDLTEEEARAIENNEEIAATERGVFNQRLDAARSLIQQGQANPERAFAEGQLAAQRGSQDTIRTAAIAGRSGLQDAERRRAAIEGARVGTAAVTGEQARAAQATQAGLSALPTNVPTTAPELSMKIYEDLYKRRSDYSRDLAGSFGQLYGNMA